MAARHTATRLGRTRGWGQCPVGPCMLEKSRGQVRRCCRSGTHGREVGWGELGHQSDTAFGGSGDTLRPFLGTWQHRDFGLGSAMCSPQRARLQVMGSRSRMSRFKSN